MSTRPDPLEDTTGDLERPPARVLLAEDDAEMRSLLQLSLEDAGYEVTALANGVDLLHELERAHRTPTRPPYGLVVSDVRMPGPTGLEILDALHGRAWLPPVILITAFGDAALHEEGRRLGAVAVLDKPFETDRLVALVGQNLSRPPSRIEDL